MKPILCHDCGAKEGQLHWWGCDMERCPKCKGQMLSCGCKVTNLSFDGRYLKIGKVAYSREPYFDVSFFCEKCGKMNPRLFMLPDKEWKEVCGVSFKKEVVLCEQCVKQIQRLRQNVKVNYSDKLLLSMKKKQKKGI